MSSQSAIRIPCGSWALIRWSLAAMAVTLMSLSALGYCASIARGQALRSDPVDTVTEAENVPREAEQAPDDAQPLPAPAVDQPSARTSQTLPPGQPLAPPTMDEGTTAAAMTAPPARIDFRRFGVKFENALTSTQPAPADQARPGTLTIAKVRTPSAASQLGLESGDEILSVGNQAVTTSTQIGQALEKALATSPREDHVAIPLVVRRNDAERTFTISNAELAMAGYGPLLTELGHYVPAQYVTGYRGAMDDPHIPANPTGAYLGVELASQYRDAAIVSRVLPGTAAARAGLQEGDRIFAINNRPIDSPNELVFWVGQMQPGDSIEISFDRAHDVDVTLGTRAPHASEQPAAASPAPAPGK